MNRAVSVLRCRKVKDPSPKQPIAYVDLLAAGVVMLYGIPIWKTDNGNSLQVGASKTPYQKDGEQKYQTHAQILEEFHAPIIHSVQRILAAKESGENEEGGDNATIPF